MTLRELRYLVAVADRAHFGRAAEDCHVSQPTLSVQIRKLEDYLGTTLLERNCKSVALTPEGLEVVEKARQIVRQVDELIASSRAPKEFLAGSLNLGIIPTLGPYFLPWLLPRLKHKHPRLQLAVQEDLTRSLLDKLKTYQIDAALLALPLPGEDLEELPLFDEPFWFACPTGHSLARSTGVTQTQLRDEPLLLLADGHCLRGQALAACGRSADGAEGGFDNFSAVSLETICQLVAAGFGSTLLPALAARAQVVPAPLSVCPVLGSNASRRIGLVWRRGYPKAEDLSALAALVRDELPPGTQPVPVKEKLLQLRPRQSASFHRTN